jgi:hypothetical protein
MPITPFLPVTRSIQKPLRYGERRIVSAQSVNLIGKFAPSNN